MHCYAPYCTAQLLKFAAAIWDHSKLMLSTIDFGNALLLQSAFLKFCIKDTNMFKIMKFLGKKKFPLAMLQTQNYPSIENLNPKPKMYIDCNVMQKHIMKGRTIT